MTATPTSTGSIDALGGRGGGNAGEGAGDAVVAFDSVSKWFGSVVAVSDVSFRIGAGVTALLGPNGAGKSTVLRLLCGLTQPSKGTVHVFGRAPRDDVELYRNIGLVPQQESILEPLTAVELVALAATLSGMDSPKDAAADALRLVELDPSDRRHVRTYSKGMRQRVKVAAALVHQPRLVVLDEPLNGLDPRQRARMIELFHSLGAEGRCVIVSSHVLDEVERLASRIVMIAEGRLAAEGEFGAIRDLMDDRPHRLRVGASPARALASALLGIEGVVGVRLIDASVLEVDVHDVAAFRDAVAPIAKQSGVRIREVVPLDDDLESVFRYLVARRY